MRKACVLLIVLWMLFPISTYADIYRYTDQNGVLRFTDNIGTVPENQRKDALNYSGRDNTCKPEKQGQDALEHRTNNKFREDPPSADQLAKIEAELDKEQAKLRKHLEAFSKEREILSTQTTSKDYKEKVKDFNGRLADYEKQRRLFQKKLDAYNAKIAK
jgi:hypothetical protein